MAKVRKILSTPNRRASIFLFAAYMVSGAIAIAGLQTVGQRTVFYAFAALIQLGLAFALFMRPSRSLTAVFVLAVLLSVAVTLIWRTVGIPSGVFGPRVLDATDAPLTAAALEVLALAVLVVGRRGTGGPATIAGPIRTAVATIAGVALTAVGVLSGASEVSSVRMASGHRVSVTELREPPGSQPLREFTIVTEPRVIGGETYWTYNGTVPGPELRVTVGDRLRIRLVNHLPESTTIHWHGVSVPNAEDGVAGLTQDAVPPGASYTYEFVVHEAGTFWFHPHQDTFHQTLRGLFAALVVLPRSGIGADRDYTVFVHESFSGGRDAREVLGGLITGAPSGQTPAFNGSVGDLRLAARPGERIRLRIVDATQGDYHVREIPEMMHAGPQELVLLGAPFQVVALDGRDLNAPGVVSPTRLRLAIGQRYDLQFTMPESGVVRLVDRDGNESLTLGDGPAPAVPDLGSLPAFDMLSYGAPAADGLTDGPWDRTYSMVLGNHLGFHEGQLQLVHTINGKASPLGTDYPVQLGERVRMVIENQTDEFHSMHLHGHPFAVLRRNDEVLHGSPIRIDSLLVGPHERWEIAFLADNQGIWMFHCHVLIHAAFGMVATVSYPGIQSPFDMGTHSGNRPE